VRLLRSSAGTVPATVPEAPARRSFARTLVAGREADPRWVRPALVVLLLATAVLYLWDLGASGWANAYYSAAVQAASQSWKAWFFGSFDAANFITVDKPPFSLWVMGLSVRLFGVNAWSILVPQALMGVASVGLLYATVRRWATPAAGLLAAAALALSPAAALMFRYNNPDALLVLLLVAAAYATVRAVENGSTRWLIAVAVLVGCGFNTKMLQAFLVVPALALTYAVAGAPRLRTRLWQLALAGVALVVSSGWWVAVVELWPVSSRPYIGGSQTNSILELVFGYNGFGRITGNETGSVGGAPGGGWGQTGWTRLFDTDWGPLIAWLLPAAAILLVAGLWLSRRQARTDKLRAAMLLWGGWLVVTWAVFCFGSGIIHSYYAVALAPAIAAVVGIGAAELWKRRERVLARLTLAGTLAATSGWAFYLLARTPEWLPLLRYAILIGGLLAAAGLAVVPLLPAGMRRRAAVAVATVGLLAALAGPTAGSLATAGTPLSGSLPSAGLSTTAGPGGMAGGPGGMPGGMPGDQGGMPGDQGTQSGDGQTGMPPGMDDGGQQGTPPARTAGMDGASDGAASTSDGAADDEANGAPAAGGGMGGLLNAGTPSAELVESLRRDADDYDWVAATPQAQSAAGLQLAADEPVMAIGGFNGSDPALTLAEFKELVEEGRVHYYVVGESGGGAPGGGPGGQTTGGGPQMGDGVLANGGPQMGAGQPGSAGGAASSSSSIAEWVQDGFSSQEIDGVTLYDLSDPL